MFTRKLQTWLRLSRLEHRLAVNGIVVVASVRLGLWLFSIQTLHRLCQSFGRIGRRSGEVSMQEIMWAVQLASRYVPKATCLVQALSTQILLVHHGHAGRVHIGVALDAKLGFRAHAWVESQGKILAGGSEELDQYAPMLVLDSAGLKGNPEHIT